MSLGGGGGSARVRSELVLPLTSGAPGSSVYGAASDQ